MNRPVQVTRAIWLQWISLIVFVVSIAFNSSRTAPLSLEETKFWILMVMLVPGIILIAIPIVYVGRCHNWARLFLLVVWIFFICSAIWWWDLINKETEVYVFGVLSSSVSQIVSIYWLFSGEGAAWFRKPDASPTDKVAA